ncbi:TolC family protein [Acetobacter indonesiensis]|uniref:TolC family protein n=1 Tax=Acetobacter indonesiensis TaxID=104101 RepID=UPI001F027A9D|nr:TolC family protein [Acetobacter indonesiensis]MCG0996443.1 TolC family protein [Acetobacter indonesiensis]
MGVSYQATLSIRLGRISTSAEMPRPPPLLGTITPTDLLRRRPDIIAAERHLAAANARIGQTLADYYSKLSLVGLVGFESLRANKMFTPAGFQPLGQGAIRWRIFDFGKIQAEVSNAHGSSLETLAVYRQTLLEATEEVENAFMSYDRNCVRVSYIENDYTNRSHLTSLAQTSFDAGADSLNVVLKARREELIVNNDLVDSRVRFAQAAVGFYRAIGGSW